MHKVSLLALTLVAAATLSAPAKSAPILWNVAAGDWFDPANWNPANVPMAGDDAFINNGGTATANSLNVQVDNLRIGWTSDPGNATGNLDIQMGDLTGTGTGFVSVGKAIFLGTIGDGTLSVDGNVSGFRGLTAGAAPSSGDAVGKVTIGGSFTGTGNGGITAGITSGDTSADGMIEVGTGISNVTTINIGVSDLGSPSTASAIGALTVLSGGAQGTGGNTALRVGWARSQGPAMGTMNVTGGVSGFKTVDIGLVENQGDATGSLTLIDGELAAESLRVGVATGTGTAIGTLNLNDNLAILSNTLELGDGAIIDLGIDGYLRGTNYGGIDTDMAILDGILTINFSFMPTTPPNAVFDLIKTGSSNGIMGDFVAVNIYGLTPGTLATYGVVTEFDLEIWRLTIGEGREIPEPPSRVAEPGTLMILVSGLMVLGLARRRRMRH